LNSRANYAQSIATIFRELYIDIIFSALKTRRAGFVTFKAGGFNHRH